MTPELPAYCENPTLCVNCGSSAVCPPWALCHRCLGDASQPRMPSDPDAAGHVLESTDGRDVRTDGTPPPATVSSDDTIPAAVVNPLTTQPTAEAATVAICQLSTVDSSTVATVNPLTVETARCRHCMTGKACRPRGLCWNCYYRVDVRVRYVTGSPYARRGLGNGNAIRPLPEPTDYPPGTVGKLLVLESRAMAGVALWHPADAGFPPDGLGGAWK